MSHSHTRQTALRKLSSRGYSFRAECYEQCQIIAVLGGSVILETSDSSRTAREGDLLLLREGAAFRLRCPHEGYTGVAFLLEGDLPAPFRGAATLLPGGPETDLPARRLLREYERPDEGTASMLLALGTALAWEAVRLERRRREGEARSGEAMARLARTALDAHLYTPLQPREILAGIPLGYRQLSRHFHEAWGVSPKQYQLRAKIEEACRLLRGTGRSVTAIALELGFHSSQHFAGQFRRLRGETPTRYRRRAAAPRTADAPDART